MYNIVDAIYQMVVSSMQFECKLYSIVKCVAGHSFGCSLRQNRMAADNNVHCQRTRTRVFHHGPNSRFVVRKHFAGYCNQYADYIEQ